MAMPMGLDSLAFDAGLLSPVEPGVPSVPAYTVTTLVAVVYLRITCRLVSATYTLPAEGASIECDERVY